METKDLRTSCDKAAVNRVWLYCRTAGNGIAYPALDVQEQRLKDYTAEQHWTVAGISSEHCSGNTIVRPGLTEVSKAVLNGKVDTVLVVNLSRIGRVMDDVNFYWAFLQKHHVGCGNTGHHQRFVDIHPTADWVNYFEHNTSPQNDI